MEEKNIKEYIKLYIYYILIAIISTLSIVVFPILGAGGNGADITASFPTTTVGWTLWIIVRVMIIVLNTLIFTNFLQQAKLNIKDNENYKKANNILLKYKSEVYAPRSPKDYLKGMYISRGIGLTITTIASLFAIGNAVLNYDYMLLIATIFTVIMSVVFGIMTMKRVEIYYITEYYDYALNIEIIKNKKNKNVEEVIDVFNNFNKNMEDYKCTQLEEKNSEI